jgi:hypothetical protein
MGEYVEITTPYLDRFNDYLQIYIKQESDGTLTLTDDGYIISNLICSGMSFKRGTNLFKTIDKIAKNYNLTIDGEEIVTKANSSNFPRKKHMMVQAMLAIDDLYQVSPEMKKDLFSDEIKLYFDANDIFYSVDFTVQGKTETVYHYDYHIQRTREKPERFCRGINRLTQSSRDLTLFNWGDTQEKRGNEGELIVIYNDFNSVSADVLKGFFNYGIKTLPFSQRQSLEYLQWFVA